MALFIQTNVASLEAQRNMARTQVALSLTMQRLSSGFRVNSASDDASGMAISQNMKAQILSYAAAERSTNNAISMSQVAEGSLGSMSGVLSRMRELAVQSSNGDLATSDRAYLSTEFTQLQSEVDRIASSTNFNGQALLSGATTSKSFQIGIGTSSADQVAISFGGITASALAVDSGAISITGANATNAQAAIVNIDAAITTVSTSRAGYGAAMNRLTMAVSSTQELRTNLSAASSRITDVDVAEETGNLARLNVLASAGAAMLAQANQAPQLAQTLVRF